MRRFRLLRSALASRSTAFDEGGASFDGRAICTGSLGLEDVPGAPGSAAMPTECNFASSSGDVCEFECPVGQETLSISTRSPLSAMGRQSKFQWYMQHKTVLC